MKITLLLDLSRHCIETELRRRHNRALSDCFRPGQDKVAAGAIVELTRQALTRFDFAHLRSRHAALAGGAASRVTLVGDQGEPVIQIDDHPIPATNRNTNQTTEQPMNRPTEQSSTNRPTKTRIPRTNL
ncbi:MAG: hypothetical protein KFF50_16575 [Desulfatitalea sp.]|nr:hypothetical protein [Desulfatitalea sp.]